MKSIHSVSTVFNVYRTAIDAYCNDPDNYQFNQAWEDELWKVAQWELATGFYYGIPTDKEQLFGERRKIPPFSFIGQVLGYDEETQTATIQQRNHFGGEDELEFYGADFTHFYQTVTELTNEKHQPVDRAANAMRTVPVQVKQPVKPFDLIRKRK